MKAAIYKNAKWHAVASSQAHGAPCGPGCKFLNRSTDTHSCFGQRVHALLGLINPCNHPKLIRSICPRECGSYSGPFCEGTVLAGLGALRQNLDRRFCRLAPPSCRGQPPNCLGTFCFQKPHGQFGRAKCTQTSSCQLVLLPRLREGRSYGCQAAYLWLASGTFELLLRLRHSIMVGT